MHEEMEVEPEPPCMRMRRWRRRARPRPRRSAAQPAAKAGRACGIRQLTENDDAISTRSARTVTLYGRDGFCNIGAPARITTQREVPRYLVPTESACAQTRSYLRTLPLGGGIVAGGGILAFRRVVGAGVCGGGGLLGSRSCRCLVPSTSTRY